VTGTRMFRSTIALIFLAGCYSTYAEDVVDDTEGLAPADLKNEPRKEKPPEKKDESKVVKKTAEAPPAPAPVCSACLGVGFVPSAPPAYIRMPGEAANPAAAVPWKFCSKCQKDKTLKDLVDAETARLSQADDLYAKWNQHSGMKHPAAETHHVSLFSHMDAGKTKSVATALEQLAQHLQQATKNCVLVQTRPNTHSIFILADDAAYQKFLAAVGKGLSPEDMKLAKKTTGMGGGPVSFFWLTKIPPEDQAVYMLGKSMVNLATGGKAKPWLQEGFASYCENAVTKKNLCYSIAYDLNQVQFGQNWNSDIAGMAKASQLKQWEEVFPMEMIGLKAKEYLTCYSIVMFLMKLDGQKFSVMCLKIKDGADSKTAIEKAYGRSIKDLQTQWGQWCLQLK
jgi:hypothetical protein